MASALDIPKEPTSGLQNLAIFITFFFPALATVVIVLRAVGRLATRQFGLEDWLISIAMFLSVAETVVSYFFIKTNFIGIRIENVPPHDPVPGRIWNYGVQILYNPILALVKCSVLIFLLRLFGQKDGVRRFIYGLTAANVAQMVGVLFAVAFQCTPIPFTWDQTVRGGSCVDQRVLFTSMAALNILTDLLVLGLPLWILVDLRIPRRTKIALLFVFLLGFLVTITSIVRLVVLVQGLFGPVPQPDPTANIGFVTSAIETNLALITASAPALRPFLRKRSRGGWLPSLGFRSAGDVEMGYSGSSAATNSTRGGRAGPGRGGGATRGGTSGGRGAGTGGRTGPGRRGRDGKRPGALRDMRIRVARDKDRQKLRSQSPRSSEEEAMTTDGVMRVSDVQREIDGMVREMALAAHAGGGSPMGGRRSLDDANLEWPRARAGRSGPDPSYSGWGAYAADRTGSAARFTAARDPAKERTPARYDDRRFGVITPMENNGPPAAGRPF